MSRLFELVISGNRLKTNISKEQINECDRWISESLLYVDKKYANTEFAKLFISDVQLFREQWINFDSLDHNTFGRLHAYLDALQSHESWLETQEVTA